MATAMTMDFLISQLLHFRCIYGYFGPRDPSNQLRGGFFMQNESNDVKIPCTVVKLCPFFVFLNISGFVVFEFLICVGQTTPKRSPNDPKCHPNVPQNYLKIISE